MKQQFEDILLMIRQTQLNTLRLVNTSLIGLYWSIGEYVSLKTANEGWGRSTVSQLAEYIATEACDAKGFSDKNIWRMKQFYEAYTDQPKLSALLREVSWTNNLTIITRTKSNEERYFYLRSCIEERYSTRELERQISASLYERTMLRDIKRSNENPSIGILLCKDKDNEVVEYALSRSLSPTMIAEYQVQLPDKKILQQRLHQLYNQTTTPTQQQI